MGPDRRLFRRPRAGRRRIAQVGGKAGPAKREIDAERPAVTPGWVDVHTHYDGQATWDPARAVVLAWRDDDPVWQLRRRLRPGAPRGSFALVRMMKGVEEIPGMALADGLPWNWERLPDFSTRSTGSSTTSMSPLRFRTPRCASRNGGARG